MLNIALVNEVMSGLPYMGGGGGGGGGGGCKVVTKYTIGRELVFHNHREILSC